MIRALRQNGTAAWLHPRGIVLYKMHNRGGSARLPVLPPTPVNDPLAAREGVERLTYRPLISIILPVYNTSPVLLQAAVNSVIGQIYPHWELCIADDHSGDPRVRRTLQLYAGDPRIHIAWLPENTGISEASNTCIGLSKGEFIALLDHDDELTSDALYWFVNELNKDPKADILYSDECKVDEQGNLSQYFLKPSWSPELLLNSMYIGHLTMYRKAFLVEKVGLFRETYDLSQDYDLVLRAMEKTTRIRHVNKVLYHWRITEGSSSAGHKPNARKTNLSALADAMRRRNIEADVLELPAANRVRLRIDKKPLVSIIIPTDSRQNLDAALKSIHTVTAYSAYEIVVVANSALVYDIQTNYSWSNLVCAAYDKPYNFSDKCNAGAARANGDILIFLNDDVRPLESGWIDDTIEYLFLAGVGGVSPKLIYENDTLQYAGMAAGVRGLTGTTFHGYQWDSTAYHRFPQLVRNVSILSGACLAIKKDLFFRLGAFDAVNTPSAHSDTDLSFRLLENGWRCVYTPYASLRHIGHLSLKDYEKGQEQQRKDKSSIHLLRRWSKYLTDDPYFPATMKNFLYHDSPEPYRLYADVQYMSGEYERDVLFVSHELTLTGAPISLFELAKLLKARGYFVAVCSPVDGPLRQMYVREGMVVIVDALLLKRHASVRHFAAQFDKLICNTVVTWPVVSQMQNILPVFWWLQEGRSILDFAQYRECAITIREAKVIIGLSEYALSYIRKLNKRAVKIYNACPDISRAGQATDAWEAIEAEREGTILFSMVGSLEKRKGQDIVLDALDHLGPEILNKLEILFIGRFHDPLFAAKARQRAGGRKFIRFLGEVSRHECLEWMRKSHVLLNASRDEPFSVALTEAFCLAKPCVVPQQAGIAELITDGQNGFTFRQADAKHLAEKIHFAVTHTDCLRAVGMAARMTYEKHLTMERFESKMINLLETGALKPQS
ncbi:MAG: glycosyltransferase [Bacteroidota bacterium]|nr:glycosyltransferase [Bacteroidota bacterium]